MLDVETIYRERAKELRRALRRRFDSSVPDVVIEDACGSTWLIAWAKRHEIRDGNAMGWLVTVAFHEALALLRKRRFERPGDGDEPVDARTSPELIREAHEALELLAGLTHNQRVALSLQVAGYSYKELAEVAGNTYTWANAISARGAPRCDNAAVSPRPNRSGHRPRESLTTRSAASRSPSASASRPAASTAGDAPLAAPLSIVASSSSAPGPRTRACALSVRARTAPTASACARGFGRSRSRGARHLRRLSDVVGS